MTLTPLSASETGLFCAGLPSARSANSAVGVSRRFELLYGFSMPKLQPTETKTVQLEFKQAFGFLCLVRSVSDGVSAKIGLRTRRSGVRVPPGAPLFIIALTLPSERKSLFLAIGIKAVGTMNPVPSFSDYGIEPLVDGALPCC
jgi:hypothetical protein